jgi:hypothetical protein
MGREVGAKTRKHARGEGRRRKVVAHLAILRRFFLCRNFNFGFLGLSVQKGVYNAKC